MRAYLRSLDPQLPRDVWILQAGGLANMFGNGVVGPFLIIYLHNVRGISLGVAGLIVGGERGGRARSGLRRRRARRPRRAARVLSGALLVMAVGFALLPADPHAVAGVRAEHARRRGQRRVLAEPVDTAQLRSPRPSGGTRRSRSSA